MTGHLFFLGHFLYAKGAACQDRLHYITQSCWDMPNLVYFNPFLLGYA